MCMETCRLLKMTRMQLSESLKISKQSKLSRSPTSTLLSLIEIDWKSNSRPSMRPKEQFLKNGKIRSTDNRRRVRRVEELSWI